MPRRPLGMGDGCVTFEHLEARVLLTGSIHGLVSDDANVDGQKYPAEAGLNDGVVGLTNAWTGAHAGWAITAENELGVLDVNFGLSAGDPDWAPTADINAGGAVNLGDLGPLNVEFGRRLPADAAEQTSAAAVSSADLPQPSADAGGISSDEFRVDWLEIPFARNSDISCFPDGRFAVVWEGFDPYEEGLGVLARVYAADGQPISDEFRVNQTTAGDQHSPQVDVADDGSFVVAWFAGAVGGEGEKVFLRRFDANGNPLAAERRVDKGALGTASTLRLSVNSSGRAALAWGANETDGIGLDVVLHVVDSDDSTVVIHRSRQGTDEARPDVAMLDAGKAVLVWSEWGGGWRIHADEFDAAGSGGYGDPSGTRRSAAIRSRMSETIRATTS